MLTAIYYPCRAQVRYLLTHYGAEHSFFVSDIAINAKSAAIYVNANELADILGVLVGAYNGVLSMERIPGGETITRAERTEELNRNAQDYFN